MSEKCLIRSDKQYELMVVDHVLEDADDDSKLALLSSIHICLRYAAFSSTEETVLLDAGSLGLGGGGPRQCASLWRLARGSE